MGGHTARRSVGWRLGPVLAALVFGTTSVACGSAAGSSGQSSTSLRAAPTATAATSSPPATPVPTPAPTAVPAPSPTADARKPITASPLRLVLTPPQAPPGFTSEGADPLSAADAVAHYRMAASTGSLTGYLHGDVSVFDLAQKARLVSIAMLFDTTDDAHAAYGAVVDTNCGGGDPVDDLGDEAGRCSAPQSSSQAAVAFEAWRDRNVVSVLVLSGQQTNVDQTTVALLATAIEVRIAHM